MVEQNRDIRGGRSVQTDRGQRGAKERDRKFNVSTKTKPNLVSKLTLQNLKFIMLSC